MKRVLALVLVLSLVVVARRAGLEDTGRFATMALGFVLIVAALLGEAGEAVRLPRVTGYLLVGLCAGPAVLDLVTTGMAQQLRLVNGLAVALIAFSAGMELDVAQLARQWRSLLRHGGALVGTLFAGLLAAALAASPWLPFSTGLSWPQRAAMALVLAAVMATFSPTVTMAVLSETRAKGPLAERVLALVVVGDLAIVLLFTLASTLARMLAGGATDVVATLGHVTWELFGSMLVGALTGAGIVAYRALVDRRSWLIVAAACLLLAEVGTRIGLSALLSCLVAGLVVRNAAPEAAHAMEALLARVRLPVLVVFFGAAGASLHLDQLEALGPIAIGLALVRYALILLGNRWGAAASGLAPEIGRRVPAGLLSQAGVTMGLAVMVGRDFGAWGAALETLFVATVSLHELAGPISFRNALARAGEIPAAAEREAAPMPLEAA
jgi:Kef-type K+ transport system membrane component KefB